MKIEPNNIFSYVYDDGGRSQYYKGKTRDCLCRAIAIVTGWDYKFVYDMIKHDLHQHPGKGIRDDRMLRLFMKNIGFEYGVCQGVLVKGKMPHKCRMVCMTRNHAIAVINGEVHDTFDSRYKRGKLRVVNGFYKWVYNNED